MSVKHFYGGAVVFLAFGIDHVVEMSKAASAQLRRNAPPPDAAELRGQREVSRLSHLRCVVFSHKLCWPHPSSPSGFATDGGFPIQMEAISQLFARTTLVVPCAGEIAPAGVTFLQGHNLSVSPMRPFRGGRRGFWLHLRTLLTWFPRHLPQYCREVMSADVVHTPIPGDVGGLALFLAFFLRKRVLVRHCGNWNRRKTFVEGVMRPFLEVVAGGRVAVLATGGGPTPPSPRNRAIQWIFSTSLTAERIRRLQPRHPRRPHSPVRLVVSMRLEHRKNAHIVVESVEKLRRRGVAATLDIFGDGSERPQLEEMCRSLGVEKLVRFHGKVPQTAVVDALTQMDILCFPSTASEGFPKAVLEALAAGVPVVSTGVSVLGHLIHQGIGRQISSPDSESLAAAVEDLVSDPSRFATISAQAHEASRQYSMENWRKTIAVLLEEQWGLSRSTARGGEGVAD